MEIHTTLVQSDLRKVSTEIRRIELAGYDGVMTQENQPGNTNNTAVLPLMRWHLLMPYVLFHTIFI